LSVPDWRTGLDVVADWGLKAPLFIFSRSGFDEHLTREARAMSASDLPHERTCSPQRIVRLVALL
jgi:hypothetical protein